MKPKPIFIMKFRMSMDDYEFSKCKDTLFKSPLADDYHIITLRNNKDTDEFEMFNADKIERQDWNELVNKNVIAAIFEKVKYGSVNLNFSNINFNALQQCKVHNNYVIDLNQNYQQTKAKYKKSIDYSLSKASKQNLRYSKEISFETAVENYKKLLLINPKLFEFRIYLNHSVYLGSKVVGGVFIK